MEAGAGQAQRRVATLVTLGIAVSVAMVLVFLSAHRSTSAGAAPTVVGTGPVHAGAPPPSFSGGTLGGGSFDLSATRGQVVIVNFFATWCSNCRDELPLLERQYERLHARGLQVVSVDFNDHGDASAFAATYGLRFAVMLDAESVVGRAYGISDLPVSVIIRRDGTVAQVFHGQLSDATLASLVPALL